MLKKQNKIFSIVLICAILAVMLSGCGDAAFKDAVMGERKEFSEQNNTITEWREELVLSQYKTTGEGITIDGKVDEPEWENLYFLEYERMDIKLRFSVKLGDEGVYIAFVADDSEVNYNAYRYDYQNSSVDLYFSGENENELNPSVLQLRCDTDGKVTTYAGIELIPGVEIAYRWTMKYIPAYGRTNILNQTPTSDVSFKGEGYSCELFIGYDSLGFSEKPERLKFFPSYNYTNTDDAEGTRLAKLEPIGQYNDPRNFYLFDEKGYMFADERLLQDLDLTEIAIGDGQTGLPKSNAWDFSEIEEGIIKMHADSARQQTLFFKDINTENYIVSAEVKHENAAVGDGGPRSGILIGMKNSTKENFYQTFFSAFMLGCNNSDKGTVRTLEEPGWVLSSNITLTDYGQTDVTEAFVKLTAVKQNAEVHYFVNDKFLTTRTVDIMYGNAVPGLITYGSVSTFKNIYASDKADVISAYLETHGN